MNHLQKTVLETMTQLRYRLYNTAMLWSVAMIVMLEDDAAMLALLLT